MDAVHPLTSSQQAYQAGRLGGPDYDLARPSRDVFLDRYPARDPYGIDQGAKQRRWSEVSTGSEDNPPSLTASQQGMSSLDRRGLIERDDSQRFRWVRAYVEPPAGIEPATPSLPWNHRDPLCGPAFPQVASDRRGRRYRFSFGEVMRSHVML